jgi:hypothetical protein
VKFSTASAGAAAKPSAIVVAAIAQIPLRFMNRLPMFIRASWRLTFTLENNPAR